MPLKIILKPHEKIFLAGAVIENGSTRASFTVLNDAAILREKDILTEAKADTPCKLAYFLVQLMYMDGENAADYQERFAVLAREIAAADPNTAELLNEIAQMVLQQKYYPALRLANQLIAYEKGLTEHGKEPS